MPTRGSADRLTSPQNLAASSTKRGGSPSESGGPSSERLLQEALIREKTLQLRIDTMVRQQDVLDGESSHRIFNCLQLIGALLWQQSRRASNAEVRSQLAVATERVLAVGRLHRRLYRVDGIETVAFKHYLDDMCRDFSAMIATEEFPAMMIAVEGVEVELPVVISTPLGFVVNELLTNAAEYGKGEIRVRLERQAGDRYALSVSNDGPVLPEDFDPAAGTGLGMKIIRTCVEQIGGQLSIDRADENQGPRFTVLFPAMSNGATRSSKNAANGSGRVCAHNTMATRTFDDRIRTKLEAVGDPLARKAMRI